MAEVWTRVLNRTLLFSNLSGFRYQQTVHYQKTILFSIAGPRRVAPAVSVDRVPARHVFGRAGGQRDVGARPVGLRPNPGGGGRERAQHDEQQPGDADARVDARGRDVLVAAEPVRVRVRVRARAR